MGDGKKQALRVSFDGRLKLEFHGANITSDAGLLVYRELDEALELTTRSGGLLDDWRTGKNTQHSLVALLRQSIFSRLAGYEDTNDAERLSVDPTMRQVVGGRATDRTAASTSQMGRFETEVLTQPRNLAELTRLSGIWIEELRERQPMRELILDLDSSVSETYGEQEGTAYNGHFDCTCYHPLFCFNQFGDVERALLREGNVHSAKDWRSVLEPVVARYRRQKIPCYFRVSAVMLPGVKQLQPVTLSFSSIQTCSSLRHTGEQTGASMKDSTMILVVAAILAAAVLPTVATSLRQVAAATETIEQVRVAAQAPSAMRAMVSSNKTVRLHSNGHNFMKGFFSL